MIAKFFIITLLSVPYAMGFMGTIPTPQQYTEYYNQLQNHLNYNQNQPMQHPFKQFNNHVHNFLQSLSHQASGQQPLGQQIYRPPQYAYEYRPQAPSSAVYFQPSGQLPYDSRYYNANSGVAVPQPRPTLFENLGQTANEIGQEIGHTFNSLIQRPSRVATVKYNEGKGAITDIVGLTENIAKKIVPKNPVSDLYEGGKGMVQDVTKGTEEFVSNINKKGMDFVKNTIGGYHQ